MKQGRFKNGVLHYALSAIPSRDPAPAAQQNQTVLQPLPEASLREQHANNGHDTNGHASLPNSPTLDVAKRNFLNSWKEIAVYMGRGVRTVQRWERELNLPVHRPRGSTKSPVVAFRNELDQWITRTPSRLRDNGQTTKADVPQLPAKVLVVEGGVKDLNTCANVLRAIGVAQVDAVSNGPVALQRLQDLASGRLPTPDLIILHLAFPVDSGCEVLRYSKSTAALKSISVVVWAATGDTEQQLSTMFSVEQAGEIEVERPMKARPGGA